MLDEKTQISWVQNSIIDLFATRTAGVTGTVDKPLIAPGSQGYYLFRLANNSKYDIKYKLTFTERSFHIPMRFKITDQTGAVIYAGWKDASMEADGTTEFITLPKGQNKVYKLCWEWQYDKDSKADTEAGTRLNRTYDVNLTIHAESIGK